MSDEIELVRTLIDEIETLERYSNLINSIPLISKKQLSEILYATKAKLQTIDVILHVCIERNAEDTCLQYGKPEKALKDQDIVTIQRDLK